MPIYEYKCQECGAEFDVLYKKISDVEREEPEEKCPKCSSDKKERVPSKTNFQLKGGGWYARHQSGE